MDPLMLAIGGNVWSKVMTETGFLLQVMDLTQGARQR